MTDVRDREPQDGLAVADTRSRATIVSRALAPIRRVAGYEVSAGQSRQLDLRVDPPLDIDQGTKSYAKIIRWSFILVVVIPSMLAGVYFLIWASNQYVAEARFAVREVVPSTGAPTSGDKTSSSHGSPLGLSTNLKSEDAEIIANYIKSRAIVDDVSRRLDLRAIFRRSGVDGLARLSANASIEDLTTYWSHMISVYVETSSGIVTVSVTAFRRDDALALARAVLASSEALANSLSIKMRADQTRLAEDEVRRSEGEVRFALANLRSFRNSEHIIDPIESSKSTSKLLFQLIAQRIEAESQLYVAGRSQGPDAPGMGSLRAKVDSINSQIKTLQDQLAGDKEESKNMASALATFEGLELKKEFAERMFTFSESSLEAARVAAIRQSVYLEVFVEPSLPQDAAFPLRFTDFALISIAALMMWICGLTVSASVLDHRI